MISSSSTSIPNGIPPSTISISRSKSHNNNNNGNHSSEGSSGTYTTSGYGSMGSPRHSTSVVSNTSSMSKPYVFPPSTSSYTTTTSSSNNNNNDINNTHPTVTIVGAEHRASHQHQPVHILHQNPTEPESQDMMDATQKESRSSYSSNEDEDEDMIEEEQSNNSNSSAISPLKRKYRRHPKPDKNAPIKPPSAYIMFSNDARAQLKGHNMTFVEIAKIVGDQWKNLGISQKQQYERTAMRAKDEYIDALNEYRKTNEYKEYQKYLNNFKAEQDATNRKIARLRKRAKRSSPGSGSLADNSSNDNARSSSSSGGSTDIYKVHRKTHINAKGSSSEEGSVLRSMDTTPTIEVSTSTTPPNEEVDDDDVDDNEENDMEECYSPQQKAPPLISDNMAESNYHRLPFNENPRPQ
ncbi:unnamed protein product [Mucor circinelloides]